MLLSAIFSSAKKVSPKTVSHWETGYTEPSVEQLVSLSKVFNVSLDELILGK